MGAWLLAIKSGDCQSDSGAEVASEPRYELRRDNVDKLLYHPLVGGNRADSVGIAREDGNTKAVCFATFGKLVDNVLEFALCELDSIGWHVIGVHTPTNVHQEHNFRTSGLDLQILKSPIRSDDG